MNNNIVFYNRNFSGSISQNLDILVERYSHSMIGGPDKATLRVRSTSDKWELFKLLRCPTEIYGKDGDLKWWGYVNRVVIPHGNLRVGLGLDNLFNSVSAKHQTGVTSAATSTESIEEYGDKQFFINLSNATEADVLAYRNTYLESHRYANIEIELSGAEDDIVIECYGWWQTLEWKYYADLLAGVLENTTQIANMVTACGQFLQGVIIHDVAGIETTRTRDGGNTALSYITELLNAGSVNYRPLLAVVDKDRYLHISERIVETTEYLMRPDGNLLNLFGKLVQPEDCLSAVWVKLKGAPDHLAGLSSLRPFFIERAEYVETDASDDGISNGVGELENFSGLRKRHGKVQYSAAGAFAQVRFDRYLQTSLSDFSGAPFTFPDIGFGGPTPTTSTVTTIKNIGLLHIPGEGLFYTTTLASGSPVWAKWEGGLTTDQQHNITRVCVVPDGEVYALCQVSGATTFLASAPGISADFTILEDYTSISAKYSGSTDNIRVANIGFDRSSPNTVVYALSQGGENIRTYIGIGGFFSAGATFTVNTNNGSSISFGAGEWCMSAGGNFVVCEGDDSSLIVSRSIGAYLLSRHCRIGITDKTYHWDDAPESGGTGEGLARGVNNCLTMTNNISQNLDANGIYEDKLVCGQQTGYYLMTSDNDHQPVRSYNGGDTWLPVSAIPGYGDTLNWYFDVASDNDNIWLAGANTVQYSEDFGSTWVDKTGNLADLVTTIEIDVIKFGL